jgi:hypothetical protein
MDFLIKYSLDIAVIVALIFCIIKALKRNVVFSCINILCLGISIALVYFLAYDWLVNFIENDALDKFGVKGLSFALDGKDYNIHSIKSFFQFLGDGLKYIESFSGSGVTVYSSDYMFGMSLTLTRIIALIIALFASYAIAYVLTWILYGFAMLFWGKAIKAHKLRILSIVINVTKTFVSLAIFAYLFNEAFGSFQSILKISQITDVNPADYPAESQEMMTNIANIIVNFKNIISTVSPVLSKAPRYELFGFLNYVDFHFLEFSINGGANIKMSVAFNNYFDSLVGSLNYLIEKTSTAASSLS